MTVPSDPRDPVSDPSMTYPTTAPSATVEGTADSRSSDSGRSKVKAAALLATVTALTEKLRREAPRKLQELQEKRVAGRHVILLEDADRVVAVGPYRDADAAREARARFPGRAEVVELLAPSAFSPVSAPSTSVTTQAPGPSGTS